MPYLFSIVHLCTSRIFTCSTSHNLTPLLFFMFNCFFVISLFLHTSHSLFYRSIVFSCLCVNVLCCFFFINLYRINVIYMLGISFLFAIDTIYIYLSVVMVWGGIMLKTSRPFICSFFFFLSFFPLFKYVCVFSHIQLFCNHRKRRLLFGSFFSYLHYHHHHH